MQDKKDEIFSKGIKIKILAVVIPLLLGIFTFNQVFFYAEPGYIYHVRTILGQERVVDDIGYSLILFGRKNAWKKAMTVLADNTTTRGISAEDGKSNTASVSLPPEKIMFLDQVSAEIEATVRFKIPTDEETFLKMAHEYRTPENLLRVALIPAFQETIRATGFLMSAEDYYSGSSTELINEFEKQMQNGIYLVKRVEVVKKTVGQQTSEADASANSSKLFGKQTKVVWEVQKQYDDKNNVLRKEQKFALYGVSVHEARITGVEPNSKFVERMQLKQKASADRAIAREQRIQEEEQKLLVVAKGDREVAERQAQMKVEQIEMTTKAETDKKKTLIVANKFKEQAKIQQETAKILLEKAKIDAEAIKVAADAEAYKKKEILTADNALAQKLEAEIAIQTVWANAYARRQVPMYVFGGSADTPTGSDSDTKTFMQLMTVDAAKRLSYSRGMGENNSSY
jgi:regulator of protease activity HflC (stomatin/prohibitin superfamily)